MDSGVLLDRRGFIAVATLVALRPLVPHGLARADDDASGHARGEHDELLARVLFKDGACPREHEKTLRALQDACALCLDQFNGRGGDLLDALVAKGVTGIPSGIDEIDFTGNSHHRMYTHRGWDVDYGAIGEDRAKWPRRRLILSQTVKWAFETIGDADCDAFCRLVYYTHVLRDHLETKDYGHYRNDLQPRYIMPLKRAHALADCEGSDLFAQFLACDNDLFAMKAPHMFGDFAANLNTCSEEAMALVASVGGIDSAEKYEKLFDCGSRLKDLLCRCVPDMLRQRDFFARTFYRP